MLEKGDSKKETLCIQSVTCISSKRPRNNQKGQTSSFHMVLSERQLTAAPILFFNQSSILISAC